MTQSISSAIIDTLEWVVTRKSPDYPGGIHLNFTDDREEFVRGEENFDVQAIQYTGFKTYLSDFRKKAVDIWLFIKNSLCG